MTARALRKIKYAKQKEVRKARETIAKKEEERLKENVTDPHQKALIRSIELAEISELAVVASFKNDILVQYLKRKPKTKDQEYYLRKKLVRQIKDMQHKGSGFAPGGAAERREKDRKRKAEGGQRKTPGQAYVDPETKKQQEKKEASRRRKAKAKAKAQKEAEEDADPLQTARLELLAKIASLEEALVQT